MRPRLILALLIVLALGQGACIPRLVKDNEITFMYWGDLKEIGIVSQLVTQFEQENPGLKVKHQRVSAGGGPYDDKLATLFSAGEQPDVFLISSYYADKYYGTGLLAELGGPARKSPVLDFKDFYPQIIRDFSADDGGVYVIPRDVAPVACLYYNKDHFKKMGQPFPSSSLSWPEPFVSLCRHLCETDAKGNTKVWAYVDDWDLADVFTVSAGGGEVDNPLKPSRCIFDNPGSILGFQFESDLIHKYHVMPSASDSTQTGGMGTAEIFKSGRVAMFYSGAWQIPNFREIKNFDWDIALPPRYSKTGKRAFQGGGAGYAMNGKLTGPRQDHAWKLIEYLCKPSTQASFAASGLLQPSNRSVAASPAFLDGQKPQNKKILLEAVKDVYPRTRFPRWREVMADGLSQAVQKIYRGEQTAQEALPPANEKVNKDFFGK